MEDSKLEIQKSVYEKLSDETGYSPAHIAIIKSTVAKNTTNMELGFFLMVAKSQGLNPFHKEIWCYKDRSNNLIVFAGRDGFLKKAQESNRWNGMSSSPVYENDNFNIDFPNSVVEHSTNGKDRGEVIGAYAILKPKDIELSTVVYIDRKDYDKGFSVWKSNPAAMCLKVAETHALKKAFGLAGLQSEYDFQEHKGVVTPVSEILEIDETTLLIEKVKEGFELYQGQDNLELQQMVAEKLSTGEATPEFLKEIGRSIGIKFDHVENQAA